MRNYLIGITDSVPNALTPAVNWIQQLLTGSAATSIAIIAVVMLGAAMLAGRVPTRRAISVVLGCFIIFSASVIADGIVSRRPSITPAPPPLPIPTPTYTPTTPPPLPYDPYAGASVPQRAPDALPPMR